MPSPTVTAHSDTSDPHGDIRVVERPDEGAGPAPAPGWRRALSTVGSDLREAPFHLLVNVIAASPLVPRVLRLALYRLAGVDLTVADVWPRVWLRSQRLSLGPAVTLNVGCVIDNAAPVTIGARTRVGHGAAFVTSTHRVGPRSERAGVRHDRRIRVGDGCWIGARAVVLPGVRIGDGCVVAAGAVVTDDCAPNGLYAGVPARRARDLA